MKIVVDSYAWIEILKGSDEGISAADILSRAVEVYTPGTVLAEIARKYTREGISGEETGKRLELITEASNVTGINSAYALLGAEVDEEMRANARSQGLNTPGLFDAIVLGTARSLGCKIITGDRHFKDLPDTIFLGQ